MFTCMIVTAGVGLALVLVIAWAFDRLIVKFFPPGE